MGSQNDAMSLTNVIIRATFLHIMCLVPVFLGVWLGTRNLKFQEHDVERGFLIEQPHPTFLNAFANWDGVWYARIARNGYEDSQNRGAFYVYFPVYPVAGGLLARITGLCEVWALLLVSHAALIGCVVLLRYYLHYRHFDAPQIDFATVVLLCLPNGMYLRFVYSESLFLFLILLAALCMERGLKPWIPAVIIGAASGVRAVGAGLVVVVLYYAWTRFGRADASMMRRMLRIVPSALLCVWGIAAYSAYLGLEFGDPLLFQRSHGMFDLRSGSTPAEKLWNLLTLEPIWSVYAGNSSAHWSAEEPYANPVFVQRFSNPIYFVAAVILVAYGQYRKWITTRELLFALVLLGIPYVTKGHDGAMQGLARYMIVVFPAWIVLARLLWMLPENVRTMLIGLSFTFLALNSARFAAWYSMT